MRDLRSKPVTEAIAHLKAEQAYQTTWTKPWGVVQSVNDASTSWLSIGDPAFGAAHFLVSTEHLNQILASL